MSGDLFRDSRLSLDILDMGANLVHAAVSHGDVGVHGGDVVEQVGVKP